MLENKQKGWHGAYSRFGKHSAEQFNEIIKKEEIFNRLYKTIKVKDFFAPDKKVNKLDYIADNLKIFQVYENEINQKLKGEKTKKIKIKKKKILNKNILNNKKFKYHNIHTDKNKTAKKKVHDALIYRPNYDFIFAKTVSGPKWDTICGRKKQKLMLDGPDFFYNLSNNDMSTNYRGEYKCMVNMDTYTKRADFLDLKDVRIRKEKAFVKDKNFENNSRSKTTNLIKTLTNFNTKSIKNMKSILKTEKSESNLDSRLIVTAHDKNSALKNRKKNFNENKDESALKACFSEPKLKGPDFKKSLTRNYLEHLRTLHSTNLLVSSVSPKYTLIQEKHNSNVKYINDSKRSKNRIKKFQGFEYNSLVDPNKYIDKYNNHIQSRVLDFNLISSRFPKNNKNRNLPCYMLGVHNRASQDNMNEKSLEMNKFFNSDLRASKTYFFPKKSYNNIINLNLIKNEITFNHKGYKELIEEGALTKFDGVTYKSYNKSKSHNLKYLLY